MTSTRFCESLIGWYTPAGGPYFCLAVLDLVTAVCVGLRPPICKSKLEVGMGLTRSFDVNSCSRIPDCNNLQIPGMLGEDSFLAGPGLGFIIDKSAFWNGPKLIAKVWSSEALKHICTA
eukprot:1154029-Pelagomonas_calceolata.AAC.1